MLCNVGKVRPGAIKVKLTPFALPFLVHMQGAGGMGLAQGFESEWED